MKSSLRKEGLKIKKARIASLMILFVLLCGCASKPAPPEKKAPAPVLPVEEPVTEQVPEIAPESEAVCFPEDYGVCSPERYQKHPTPMTQELQYLRALLDVELTEDRRENLVAIVQSQLGYRESTTDLCETLRYGLTGRTAYGTWYGDPYGPWCAMFVSYCLHFAGIPQQIIPYCGNCEDWIELLEARATEENFLAYLPYGAYDPKPGDLVFLKTDDRLPDRSDHMGVLSEIDEQKQLLHIIAGNSGDLVYDLVLPFDDPQIVGYGLLEPQVMPALTDGTVSQRCRDWILSISGHYPAGSRFSVTMENTPDDGLLLSPNFYYSGGGTWLRTEPVLLQVEVADPKDKCKYAVTVRTSFSEETCILSFDFPLALPIPPSTILEVEAVLWEEAPFPDD